jgi:hypothetical protein
MHENWHCYFDTDDLREHKKKVLRMQREAHAFWTTLRVRTRARHPLPCPFMQIILDATALRQHRTCARPPDPP